MSIGAPLFSQADLSVVPDKMLREKGALLRLEILEAGWTEEDRKTVLADPDQLEPELRQEIAELLAELDNLAVMPNYHKLKAVYHLPLDTEPDYRSQVRRLEEIGRGDKITVGYELSWVGKKA